MRMFKKAAVAAMSKLSGSLTNPSVANILGAFGKGFFAGGNSSGGTYTSAIRKLDFVTEALSTLVATLTQARAWISSTSSRAKGYFMGGYANGVKNRVEALVGATETCASSTAALSTARSQATGIDGISKGYSCFGQTSSGYTVSQEGLDYSTEAVSTLSIISGATRYDVCGTQSPTEGITAGGVVNTGAMLSSLQGFTFATHALVTMGSFAAARSKVAAVASEFKALFGGGYNASWGSSSTIEALDFSTRAMSSHSATISGPRTEIADASSSVRGYFEGGNSFKDIVEYINFATDTRTVLYTAAGTAGYSAKAGANIVVFSNGVGFYGGGAAGTVKTSIDAFMFDSQTATGMGSALGAARHNGAGLSKTDRGYFVGGASGSALTSTEGFTYSTWVRYSMSAQMSSARSGNAGATSSTKGYVAGGNNSTAIDALAFANETYQTSSMVMDLTVQQLMGTQSSTKGYFMGGQASGVLRPRIDVLTFSTETKVVGSSPLVTSRWAGATLASSTKGYVCGGCLSGWTPTSSIESLDFATETVSAMAASMSLARYLPGGTQSVSRGFLAGGYGSTYSAEIDGLDFSTGTALNPAATLPNAEKMGPIGISYIF